MNEKLKEIRTHLADLHEQWGNDTEDGHHKPGEGFVALRYEMDNWFESKDREDYINQEPKLVALEVYSYLFGPSRLHTFNSIEQAHKEVLKWKYERNSTNNRQPR